MGINANTYWNLWMEFSKLLKNRGIINIDKKSRFNLQVGLLFSQRGTRIEPEFFQVNPRKTNILHLDYAEVPFLFHLNLHEPDKGFFLEAGFSYNRLVDFRVDEILDDRPTNSFEDLSDNFIKDELHVIAALGHYINSEFSILLRYNMGITDLYTIDEEQVFQGGNQAAIESVIGRKYPHLKNYELSLNLIYIIESKQARKKRLRQKRKKRTKK